MPPERSFFRTSSSFWNRPRPGLRSNRIENLLQEQLTFVDAYRQGPRDHLPGNLNANRAAFESVAAPEGEIPARPDPETVAFDPNADTDLRKMQLNWWNKLWIRFRAVRGFVGSLVLGEGDWRNLFIQSGKPFTANDLATVRKYSRLLDSLNDYAQMRLMVRAFANEPAAVYSHLTELTAAETAEFEQGFQTIDSYVSAVKVKGKGLPLNDIVYEAQSRILNVIERCNTLGGKLNGGELGDRRHRQSRKERRRGPSQPQPRRGADQRGSPIG